MTCERALAVIAAEHAAPKGLLLLGETVCDLTRCPVEIATDTGVPR
jgi:hypothetical protein